MHITFFQEHLCFMFRAVTYMFARHSSINATWFVTQASGRRNYTICLILCHQEFSKRFAHNITHPPFRIISFTQLLKMYTTCVFKVLTLETNSEKVGTLCVCVCVCLCICVCVGGVRVCLYNNAINTYTETFITITMWKYTWFIPLMLISISMITLFISQRSCSLQTRILYSLLSKIIICQVFQV